MPTLVDIVGRLHFDLLNSIKRSKVMTEVRDFPMCCTAKVVVNFGSSSTTSGDGEHVSKKTLMKEIKAHMESTYYKSKGFLSAVTTSQQVPAIEALTELGWESTPWMTKRSHSNYPIKLWWYPMKGYLKDQDKIVLGECNHTQE
jgi:hypothetical protein